MKRDSKSNGIGLTSVLTLIFIVLKCVGVINWSWWWVFSPSLIAFGLWVVALIVYVVIETYYHNKK